jgi:hypothetical protein
LSEGKVALTAFWLFGEREPNALTLLRLSKAPGAPQEERQCQKTGQARNSSRTTYEMRHTDDHAEPGQLIHAGGFGCEPSGE